MSDALARLRAAQSDVKQIADELYHATTSKRSERQDAARRLNAVAASLKSVEIALDDDDAFRVGRIETVRE